MSLYQLFPPQGQAVEVNPFTPHQAGTSPLEVWYSGVVNQTSYGTVTRTVDAICAFPVTLGRSGIIDALGFEVTTGAAGVARCGIYRATGPGDLYPSTLVVDGGEKDVSGTGTKLTTGLSVFLSAGHYWFCYVAGTTAPACRAAARANVAPTIGIATTIGANPFYALTVAFSYAALPATFPASGALTSTASAGGVLVHIRWLT